jgi:hypothetical protein
MINVKIAAVKTAQKTKEIPKDKLLKIFSFNVF